MAKSGNRMYNLDKSACGKRGDAENAGTIRARVRAESEESGNRRHNPSEYTCGKRRRAETAGTIRARVPAESEEMQKRVYLERIRFAFQRSTMEKTFPVVSP